jgi:hypothetical protein
MIGKSYVFPPGLKLKLGSNAMTAKSIEEMCVLGGSGEEREDEMS